MALLVAIVSIVTPKLTQFFAGRDLDSEARRFVALTHYAQSRAVSDGVPMILWVDPKAGTYGLEQESGYADADTKAVNYKLASGLTIQATSPASSKTKIVSKRSGIHFSPDGNTVINTSVSSVSLQQGSGAQLWILPSANGLRYEVQTQNSKLASLRR